MENFGLIKDLILKHKFRYTAGILSLVIVDILQLILPRLLGRITDLLKSGMLGISGLRLYSIYILLIALGIAFFRFVWRYLVLGSSRMIETELRNRFYSHLLNLSASYFNKHKTGDLMAHATNDIGNVNMALGQGVAVLFDSVLIPVIAVVMMVNTVGINLTFVSFIPLLFLAFIIGKMFKTMHERIQSMQESFSQLTEAARENFSGIRVIKAFVQEAKEIDKFEACNKRNREMNLKYTRLMSILFPTVMSVSAFSFAAALWYGGILVINSEISLGDFIAFNGYLGMLIWPIAALGWMISIFQRGMVSLKRINVIMKEKQEVADSPHSIDLKSIGGNIEFRNLSFSYPGNSSSVLKNINLTLQKGEILAVVGRTGSGKSTMANLIQRLYNIEDGKLLIDGNDIDRIPLSILRSGIAAVPQDTLLFSATIRDNINFYGSYSEAEIINAAGIARIYDDMIGLPQGFDTVLGERGVNLSGGQKQRVAIARALIRNPSVLILDDCLSAVDAGTEEEILKDLKEFMQQRTSIIISHRISAIKYADQIIVLENGEIVEQGSHETLLELGGIYYGMYEKQILEKQLETTE